MMQISRVTATDKALAKIAELEKRHGPLMFHQSGGCCDGSSPMCFPRGELLIGEEQDVQLGEIGGQPFYIGVDQYEYWKHTQIIVDLIAGRGGMFSLEGPDGVRFLTRSRIFTDEEWQLLIKQHPELEKGG